MTREQAIEIARAAAKAMPPSYYAEPFEPHPWVVDAIVAASDHERDEIEPLRRDRNEAVACREGWRAEIDAARAALRREQDARAELRVELDRTKAERDKLQLAAPVMITVMALLADEADIADVREIVLWFLRNDLDHLNTWLDAERARMAREPCCPSAALPGGTHDVGCRGGGKVH